MYTYRTHLAPVCSLHFQKSHHIYLNNLHVNVRHQSNLASLLSEKDDLFLNAVQ